MLGPNGAGKTTLINLLSGDLDASSGSVIYKGEDITRACRGSPVADGHRPQLPEDEHLPGVHRLRELPAGRAVARRRARCTCSPTPPRFGRSPKRPSARSRRPGLAGRGGRIASALSHGEQRQLEIAMVLATQPEVLLLDEPLAGMGAEEAALMVELLRRLAPRHAILLVEHDMDAVFAVADTITVMVNGQVLESGPPAQIRASAAVRDAYLGTEFAGAAA